MNEAIENEIYEVEELIASLTSHPAISSNYEMLAELKIHLLRLQQKLNSREELDNARPLSLGGEVST